MLAVRITYVTDALFGHVRVKHENRTRLRCHRGCIISRSRINRWAPRETKRADTRAKKKSRGFQPVCHFLSHQDSGKGERKIEGAGIVEKRSEREGELFTEEVDLMIGSILGSWVARVWGEEKKERTQMCV